MIFEYSISKIFGYFVSKRNKRYDNGKILPYKCSIPVISIGNLSVGGTGKTPFVQMIARELMNTGKKPAIIGLGYKRQGRGELIISDGEKIFADVTQCGDEMLLLANSINVPIVVHEQKYKAAQVVESNFQVDCIIVDDAFQHRMLGRNLDIVLIDNQTINNPYLLPKGRLREPLSAISRADVICLAEDVEAERETFPKIKENSLLIRSRIISEKPYNLLTNAVLSNEEYSLVKVNMITVSAIANPQRFTAMLKKSEINFAYTFQFNDHHNYRITDINKIIKIAKSSGINYIGTTEKDGTKLVKFKEQFTNYGLELIVFPISLQISEGKELFLKRILEVFLI